MAKTYASLQLQLDPGGLQVELEWQERGVYGGSISLGGVLVHVEALEVRGNPVVAVNTARDSDIRRWRKDNRQCIPRLYVEAGGRRRFFLVLQVGAV